MPIRINPRYRDFAFRIGGEPITAKLWFNKRLDEGSPDLELAAADAWWLVTSITDPAEVARGLAGWGWFRAVTFVAGIK